MKILQTNRFILGHGKWNKRRTIDLLIDERFQNAAVDSEHRVSALLVPKALQSNKLYVSLKNIVGRKTALKQTAKKTASNNVLMQLFLAYQGDLLNVNAVS